MYTYRNPTFPGPNTPQAIVDFVHMLKDPEWLASMVKAAKSLNEINKLTEKEADTLKEAQETIKLADEAQADALAAIKKLEAIQEEIRLGKAEMKVREQQTDQRNTDLAIREQAASSLMAEAEQKVAEAARLAASNANVSAYHVREKARLTNLENSLREQASEIETFTSRLAHKKTG